MPHPDSWFIEWLTAQKLVTVEALRAAQAKRDAETRSAPLLGPFPTLGEILEREGLITREQREAGEREAGARAGAFMNWRSQAIAEQQRKQLPPLP